MTTNTHPRSVELPTRRSLLLGTLGAGATLGLAACGSSEDGGGDNAGAAGQHHQVSLRGKLGTTEIDGTPKRIVTLGIGPDTGTCLALGVTPVAIARDTNIEGGIEPWNRTALGSHKPTLLDTVNGDPLEAIAAATPDLIVATTDYTLAQSYDKLTAIAPVLGYTSGPNTDRWQDTVTRLGTALDRSAKAKSVIAGVEKKVGDLRSAHPQLAGKTFTFGPVQPDGTVYTVCKPADLSAALLAQLGMTLSPKVTGLTPSNTPGKAKLSPEQLGLLDADVLILTYVDPAAQKKLEANPLFQRIPAVKRGAYVAVPFAVAIAAAFPDPLSVPYALDAMVPHLAAAVR